MIKHKFISLVVIPMTFLIFCSVSNAGEPLWKSESWDKGRQLVWANPGKSGPLGKPGNWLDDGKPAKNAPDRETDVLLPAADQHYTVTGSRKQQVRHVEVEENAELKGGHRNELEIWGNVDIKPGGWIKFISIRGDKDTYFNIEESKFPGDGRLYNHVRNKIPVSKRCNSHISHKFQVAKIGAKSVEFISNVGVSDEVMIQHGKCIISGDFRFSGATNKGAFEVFDGGILEIQSGGSLATMINDNKKRVYNVNIYRNGVLQAGSPERPLTEDAYIYLGFAENKKPGDSGLYAALGSFIRVYSQNPRNARLVFSSVTAKEGMGDGQGRSMGDKQEKADDNKGITLQVAGDIKLDGVHFDYLAKEGLKLYDPDVFDTWSNVTFGSNNASGSERGLLAKMKADPNTYYHRRSDQKSEYNLTMMAMKSMGEHLDKYDPFQLKALPKNTEIKLLGKGKEQIKTPVAVIFDGSVEVKLECKVPGAEIRYTTDGSIPGSNAARYNSPIKLNESTKLTVRAYKLGVGFSPTYTTSYVIQ